MINNNRSGIHEDWLIGLNEQTYVRYYFEMFHPLNSVFLVKNVKYNKKRQTADEKIECSSLHFLHYLNKF